MKKSLGTKNCAVFINLFFFLFFLGSPFLFSQEQFSNCSEEELLRRVSNHLWIHDSQAALEEVSFLVKGKKRSLALREVYLRTLAEKGENAILSQELKEYLEKFPPSEKKERMRLLLEEISWSLLRKGAHSESSLVRLFTGLGAYFTQDARAVEILHSLLEDDNSMIRAVIVELSCDYRDASLQKKIAELFENESSWKVRLEVIRAIGVLKMKTMAQKLQEIAGEERISFEERARAIEALVNIYEKISLEEWKILARSPKAGLRQLACEIATHLELKEAKQEILKLLQDPRPDVRIASLNGFSLFYGKLCSAQEREEVLSLLLLDSNPIVAISASRCALLFDLPKAQEQFSLFLHDKREEYRRFAAAVLASCGKKGVNLARKALKESSDPFVRANLALGLIGQRKDIASSCDVLYDFLQNKTEKWMWDLSKNPMISFLAPSQVTHKEGIVNYPEVVDQLTCLHLLSLLATVEDPRSLVALKGFLQKKEWGITGVAAATLLQEGDEKALEDLRQLLEDRDPHIKFQAAFVLAFLGKDRSAIPVLQAAYPMADHEMKMRILEALGYLGKEELLSFFAETLEEPFQVLRIMGSSGLIRSVNH